MNKMSKKFIKLASNQIQIGLDIGGTLTKMSLRLSKFNKEKNDFYKEFDSLECIEIDDYLLYIKLFQTNKFNTDAIEFLRSKIFLNKFLYFT
jgi:pantothenate kinase